MLLSLPPLIALVTSLATSPPVVPELRREELMRALHEGGYTIVLRHARTDRTFQEEMGSVPRERTKQRNLNDDGVRDARLMGEVLRKYRIPIGDIVTSPMYRATETAEYAVRAPTSTTMVLRDFPSPPAAAALIAAAPKPGTNTLIITHHFVIETHVPGIRPGEIAESEAVVVRSVGDGKVEVVGRITLADWQALGGATASGPAPAAMAHQPAGTPTTGTPAGGAPPVEVALPGTPLGRIAADYLRAFNTGDTTRMREAIERVLLQDPARPLQARIDTYRRLHGDFGRLVPVAVETDAATELVVRAHSAARGDVRITFRLSPDQPGRLAGVTFAAQPGAGHP